MNYENIISNKIWEIISKLLSQDIMAAIIFNENGLKLKIDIKTFYKQNHFFNFNELFHPSKNIFKKGKSTKLIIYTFSKLLESVIKEDNPIMSQFGNIKRENIIERIVKSIKYDSDFDNIINDFYENNKKQVLIFKFNDHDLDKINQIKFKINDIENENNKNRIRINNDKEKHVIFIICLNRHKKENKKNDKNSTLDDLISNIDEEYKQYFIDNLSGKNDSNITEIMSKSPKDYIEQIFDNKNNHLFKIFQKVFSFFAYEFKTKNIEPQDYIGEIMNKLLNNDYLLNLLKEKLSNELGKTLINFVKTIFSKGFFEKNDIEFTEIIFNSIYDKVSLFIFKFIFKAEKDHFLYPLLQNYDFIKNEDILKQYIQKYITNLDFSLINGVERNSSNQILLFMNLKLPLSKKWYNLINVFIENNIKEDYLSNENHIRFTYFEEDNIMKEIDKYEKINQDIIAGSSSDFTVDTMNWSSSTNVKEGKVAPGMTGYFDITIDPNQTDTSIRYDVTFDFSNLDENQFTIDRIIEVDNKGIVRTGVNTYSNIITLNEINNHETNTIRVYLTWINDEDNNEKDSELGKVANNVVNIPVTVSASQHFSGETLTPYTGA